MSEAQKKTDNPDQLPADPAKAVQHVTKLAQKLIAIMEQENTALAMNDSVSFTAAQDEKKRLTDAYQACSVQFGDRLMDFRVVDKTLLDKLDATQQELKKKTLENTAVMERMKKDGMEEG